MFMYIKNKLLIMVTHFSWSRIFIVIHTYICYHHGKFGEKLQQTQLFVGISHEPYLPIKYHTKTNE